VRRLRTQDLQPIRIVQQQITAKCLATLLDCYSAASAAPLHLVLYQMMTTLRSTTTLMTLMPVKTMIEETTRAAVWRLYAPSA
jgi:hypothetical protein